MCELRKKKIRTMVRNIKNFRISGLCPTPGRPENTTFRKLEPIPSSGEGMKAPTLLGPLERSKLNHWTSSGTSVGVNCYLLARKV
jgi:hypothetical protein